ncbi:hypothetical protein [Rhodanobacter sp. BL-MT-08]
MHPEIPQHAAAPTLAESAHGSPAAGRFEQLPKWLNLVPMVVQWAWLGFRYGSLTLPSAANPRITAGGLVGEGKLEYFRIMGALALGACAEHVGVLIGAQTVLTDLTDAMARTGLQFPVMVKPDLGWCGFGVNKISERPELERYLSRYPREQTLLLQRYLPEDGEAGLFYAREPDSAAGELIGVLLRHYPQAVGNGRDTLAELVAGDARLRRSMGSHLHRGDYEPAYVPRAGEKVRLSTIASTRVGGLYEDATALVTPALRARVDAIARDMRDFHIGRFDVRFTTLEALQRGEFTIMEVNGAGSEAVHAWDPKYSIRQVYRMVFAKQRLLFRIADANRRKGHRPIGKMRLARLYLEQQRLMALYPPSN